MHVPYLTKPLHNHDIVSAHLNIFLLHRDLRQTKEGLSYVSLHIYQWRWLLINIFYALAKVYTPFFVVGCSLWQYLLDSLLHWLGCVSCFSMPIPALRWLCHWIWKQSTFHEYLESTAHLGWTQSVPKLGSDTWHNIIYTSQNNFKSSSTTQNWRNLQHATIL